ncbi:hypothetical protein D3C71_1875840 [compost metagenome]
MRIEVGAGVVDQAVRVCLQDAVLEPFADQAALAITAVRVEAIADDATAVLDNIGDDGDEAGCHLREVDIGIADGRSDGLSDFADVDDTHLNLRFSF